MDLPEGVGDWALAVTIACLWLVTFVNARRITWLERKMVDDGEQAADNADEPSEG